MDSQKRKKLDNIDILRGQTQKGVNKTILQELLGRFNESSQKRILDLPCGGLEFLNYVHILYPNWELEGFDLYAPTFNNKVILLRRLQGLGLIRLLQQWWHLRLMTFSGMSSSSGTRS